VGRAPATIPTDQPILSQEPALVLMRLKEAEMESTQAPFLREGEAASLLRLAAGTLQNRRIAGNGPPYLKLGGRIVYARADLVAWAEAQRRTSTSDSGPEPKKLRTRRAG
jgi:hypothetical protein